MENNKVFFTISEIKIMSAMHYLEQGGIVAHKIDKRDTAHVGAFGDIEIHVDAADEAKAKQILIDAEILTTKDH